MIEDATSAIGEQLKGAINDIEKTFQREGQVDVSIKLQLQEFKGKIRGNATVTFTTDKYKTNKTLSYIPNQKTLEFTSKQAAASEI
jgi:hypothetical protein